VCISDVPGFVKQTSTPASHSDRRSTSAPVAGSPDGKASGVDEELTGRDCLTDGSEGAFSTEASLMRLVGIVALWFSAASGHR
jgi:hypothetical protein